MFLLKVLLFFNLSLSVYCLDIDPFFLTLCQELNNLELCQRISNFSEISMNKELSKDLLFLNSPKSSYIYKDFKKINTLIDKSGVSKMEVFFKNDIVYKFTNNFIYKGLELPINVVNKRKRWEQLLKSIPDSTFYKKLKKDGYSYFKVIGKYKKKTFRIELTIKSYLSLLARIKISFKD
ncbi:MAG: hypothetical protein COB02_17255 [Candidatus Cloacimonadota bacterium]|nr:MAG: hypothetical protein COB02_17255 [Candidatus Cloacimonadota bacterium]